MNYCKKCVQPDTRPQIYFKNGICGACIWNEEKKTVDWDKRERELKNLVKWAKNEAQKRNTYDAVLGVSGGKDTTFTALYAKELGLNCLLVNLAPIKITKNGQHNIDNLLWHGFDMYIIKPNPLVLKKLMRRDFFKYLNPLKATEYPLWCSTYQVAVDKNIPLVIQGENGALTLGLKGIPKNEDASQIYKEDTIKGCQKMKEYSDVVNKKDLHLYQFPGPKLFEQKNIKAIWLQYYAKEWTPSHNAEYAIKHGFKTRDDKPEEIGKVNPYWGVDSDFPPVNQLLKYVKFGFGFATDEACYDMRDGLITREEAWERIKKYDGKCSEKYIKNFCDFIDITPDEFWQTVEKFRNKNLFEKVNEEWKLKTNHK